MNAAMPTPLADLPPGLVWRADSFAHVTEKTWPTGYAALDAELPGGGWPGGAITELLADTPGIGSIELLLPMLRRAPVERWIAWVAPPCLPYAPALADAGLALSQLILIDPPQHSALVWATRQATASGACHAVMAWVHKIDMAALRRLQLAAEASATPLFLYRPLAAASQPSPACLRLQLTPEENAIGISILKRRGPASARTLHLPLRKRYPARNPHALDSPDTARPALASLHARRG
ncbi:MAG: translesion DNA synthesis-associated protein ImuA [Rhodocyclales bacterium]|nr:translesion DNA synthesis-associated protein ImuA [Rhodocyclales bacterium]